MRIGAALFVLLLVATLASAIAVVYARQQHRDLFILLNALQRQRDAMNIEFGRLQLEQATWAETNRVEQIATGKLGMVYPASKDIVVVRPMHMDLQVPRAQSLPRTRSGDAQERP